MGSPSEALRFGTPGKDGQCAGIEAVQQLLVAEHGPWRGGPSGWEPTLSADTRAVDSLEAELRALASSFPAHEVIRTNGDLFPPCFPRGRGKRRPGRARSPFRLRFPELHRVSAAGDAAAGAGPVRVGELAARLVQALAGVRAGDSRDSRSLGDLH